MSESQRVRLIGHDVHVWLTYMTHHGGGQSLLLAKPMTPHSERWLIHFQPPAWFASRLYLPVRIYRKLQSVWKQRRMITSAHFTTSRLYVLSRSVCKAAIKLIASSWEELTCPGWAALLLVSLKPAGPRHVQHQIIRNARTTNTFRVYVFRSSSLNELYWTRIGVNKTAVL